MRSFKRPLKIITVIMILSALILLIGYGAAYSLTATLVSPTTINLSWPPNMFYHYYDIYRNWEYLVTVYGTSFSDQNLDTGTEYCYTVCSSYLSITSCSNMVCVTTPGVPTIKVPSTKQTFRYPPIVSPQRSTNPSSAMPCGIGPVAMNGDTLSIQISTYQFSGPVDIYGAYILSSNPQTVFNLNPDFSFQTFSVDQINQALSIGQIPVGAEPLMRNVIGPVDINPIITVPISGLPLGMYNLYLLVTPTGSIQSYYLWNTYFSLPLLQNTVWTWGNNFSGQLGDGTKTDRFTRVWVRGLSGVTAIAAGYNHTVALKSDGTVWTWGQNGDGQLGDGTALYRYTPVKVSGLSSVSAIAAGDFNTVALKADGTVWVWGENYYDPLEYGTITIRLTPVQVVGLSGVTAIAAGYYHTVALK